MLFRIAQEEDDAPEVRCASVEALPAWGRSQACSLLTGIFRNTQVRTAARDTLRNMGPVTGDMEANLLANLAAFKSGNSRFGVAMLPDQFGADPRVLEFLRKTLLSPDHYAREQAVTGLCRLGEAESALAAADDKELRVRLQLCQELGWNRIRSGEEVLRRLSVDPEPAVSQAAKIALRQLARQERPDLPRSGWPALLAEISSVRLADPAVSAKVPGTMVGAGWLGEPGATEEHIRAAEQRLGVGLPPSYRRFLAETNGFHELSPFIYRLFGTSEIDWFRNLNPDWIDAYQHNGGDDLSPEEHLRDPSDSVRFRTAYLSSCLQISDEGDSAVVLLNPEVVTPEGEWETWFFANWQPGATRFRSFRAYMDEVLESAYDLSNVS